MTAVDMKLIFDLRAGPVVRLLLGILLIVKLVGSSRGERSSDNKRTTHTRVQLSAEKRLIRELLDNYDLVGRHGRPVLNITSTVPVEFGLGLIQMELDEKYKLLKMSMWSRYKWRDEYLMWNPDNYSGVSKIRLAPYLVWIPDIMLYNTADPSENTREVLTVISHDGTVLWVPHQIFKSSCSLDVTNFPFDSQRCNMWFGSWTYVKKELDLHMTSPEGIDLSTFQSDYKESSEWDIENVSAARKILPSENDSQAYAVLTFELNLKRKLVFSSYILTLPCVFLACLTLVVFWLPPDRPDRTALAMSIFASFLVLLLILVEAAPPTASSVPLLGVYYCFNMVIIMLSVFLSSLVVNICRAGEDGRKVPKWLKIVILDGIARFLFVSQEKGTPEERIAILRSSHSGARRAVSNTKMCNVTTYNGASKVGHGDAGPKDSLSPLQTQINNVHKSLLVITSNLADREKYNASYYELVRQWRDIALVFDRIFFATYIIIITVSLVTLFPKPK